MTSNYDNDKMDQWLQDALQQCIDHVRRTLQGVNLSRSPRAARYSEMHFDIRLSSDTITCRMRYLPQKVPLEVYVPPWLDLYECRARLSTTYALHLKVAA